MNKSFRITTIVTVLIALVAFAGVTAAFAQGPNQTGGSTSSGMSQAANGAGQGLGAMAVDEAALHAAIANALGMNIDDFEAAIAAGKTPYILAQELGVDYAVVQAAMNEAHKEALQQSVANGLINQGQADWILSRRGGQGRQGSGMNSNPSSTSGGRMGHGAGGYGSQAGDCLYATP